MKKFIVFMLIITFALFAFGCQMGRGNNSDSSKLNIPSTSSIKESSSLSSSSSFVETFSYNLTVIPQTEASYISVTLYVNGIVVPSAQVGQEVSYKITTSEPVRRSIGVVLVNGETIYSSDGYCQTVTGSTVMIEGGINISVELIMQSTNT